MKTLGFMTALIVAFAASAGVAKADHWDEHRTYVYEGDTRVYYDAPDYRSAYVEEYRSGDCTVQRTWVGNGYQEEVTCAAPAPPAYVAPPAYTAPPAYHVSPPGY